MRKMIYHPKALTRAKELRVTRDDVFRKIHIAESEGQRCKNEVRVWLQEVETLQRKVTTIENDYARAGCCRIFPFKKQATEILREAEELQIRGKSLNVVEKPPPESVLEVPTTSVAVGMESYLQEIRHSLEDDGVGIIGIWGMGGVGKTTLLQEVNNSFLPRSSEFDYVIWAAIPKEFNLRELQRSIGSRLNLCFPEYARANLQAAAIFNFLKNKKFVLLLDGLWEAVDLRDVGIPQPGSQGRRKVVFTTRSNTVCHRMEADKAIKVSCVNPEAARCLFKKLEQAGEEIVDDSDPRITSTAKKVVDELPLALTVFGWPTTTIKDIQVQWHAITTMGMSLIPDATGFPLTQQQVTNMFETLKLSYDRLLNDSMKPCFLCCSWWPRDCNIRYDELIECWMGLGLIDNFDDMDDAYLKGHSVIESLKEACLLEPGDNGGREVKMHDLIRALALWIASGSGKKDGGWMVEAGLGLREAPDGETWAEVGRISLMDNEIAGLPERLDYCSRLASLTLRRNHPLKSIPDGFFSFMNNLEYLDLSQTNVKELPPSICHLDKMQYLNLSHTPISSLPEPMGRLESLKYLHLAYTPRLSKIARGVIPNLSKLRLLDLYRSGYTDWEGEGNTGFKELDCSEPSLKALGITIRTISAFEHLTSSSQSRASTWRLSITGLEDSTSPHLSVPIVLRSLQELAIEDCKTLKKLTLMGEEAEGEMKHRWLLSFSRLEILHLCGLRELEEIITPLVFTRQLLPSLHYLEIRSCDKLKNVTWVLHLPCLEELRLSACTQMKQVIDNVKDGDSEEATAPFSSIRTLSLTNLPELRSICDCKIAFPSLEYIEVFGCPELKELPFKERGLIRKIEADPMWWEGLEDGHIKSIFSPLLSGGKKGTGMEDIVEENNDTEAAVSAPVPSHILSHDEKQTDIVEENNDREELESASLPSDLLSRNKKRTGLEDAADENIDRDELISASIPSQLVSHDKKQTGREDVEENNDREELLSASLPSDLLSHDKKRTGLEDVAEESIDRELVDVVEENNDREELLSASLPSDLLSHDKKQTGLEDVAEESIDRELEDVVEENNDREEPVSTSLPSDLLSHDKKRTGLEDVAEESIDRELEDVVEENNDKEELVSTSLPSDLLSHDKKQTEENIDKEELISASTTSQLLYHDKKQTRLEDVVEENNDREEVVPAPLPSDLLSHDKKRTEKNVDRDELTSASIFISRDEKQIGMEKNDSRSAPIVHTFIPPSEHSKCKNTTNLSGTNSGNTNEYGAMMRLRGCLCKALFSHLLSSYKKRTGENNDSEELVSASIPFIPHFTIKYEQFRQSQVWMI